MQRAPALASIVMVRVWDTRAGLGDRPQLPLFKPVEQAHAGQVYLQLRSLISAVIAKFPALGTALL